MRKLWPIIAVSVLLTFFVAAQVFAFATTGDDIITLLNSVFSTHAEVTITATPEMPEEAGAPHAPTNFQVWYISDNVVGLSWTKGVSANNTMIRASYNDWPASKDDDYQVYYGPAENTTDNATNFDLFLGLVRYRAWSDNSTGSDNETAGWSTTYAEASLGEFAVRELTELLGSISGTMLTLIPLVLISLLAFWHRDRLLYILTGFALLIFGFSFYRTSVYISIILALLGIYCFVKAAWDKKKARESE